MPKKKTIPSTLFVRAGEIVDKIDELTCERQTLYTEHDELAIQLENVSPEVLLAHRLELQKPFEKGNTQWGHGPVRRLKLCRPKPGQKKADK